VHVAVTGPPAPLVVAAPNPGSPLDRAVARLRDGGIVVVVDDEDRENEGDLVMAAQAATGPAVAFFLEHTSGYLCAPISPARAGELDLPAMTEHNSEVHRTAFLVGVDHVLAGDAPESATGRAATLRGLAGPGGASTDFRRPGSVLPLQGRAGGVLRRSGHTEASLDLCVLAGLEPAALICELVTADRRGMMRGPEIAVLAERHDLPVVTIAELVRHRRRSERLVVRTGEREIRTPAGLLRAIAFRALLEDVEHVAFIAGDPTAADDVLVRVHSECVTGDVLGSLKCDCGTQLQLALERIADEGTGVVLYLRGHEGRGIGLGQKLRAYRLQEQGVDTVDANLALGLPVDSREYGVGAQILVDLGVRRLRLMSNNPAKFGGLQGFGLTVVERVPLEVAPNAHSMAYLQTKRDRMGHSLTAPQSAGPSGHTTTTVSTATQELPGSEVTPDDERV